VPSDTVEKILFFGASDRPLPHEASKKAKITVKALLSNYNLSESAHNVII
jgi:hypothetical protein